METLIKCLSTLASLTFVAGLLLYGFDVISFNGFVRIYVIGLSIFIVLLVTILWEDD